MAVLDIDSLGIVQGPPLVFDQTFKQTVLNDNTITQLGYQYLPDAASYLVLNAVYKMQATTMTANRALIVPNAVYDGARIGIFNANTTAYTLTLSGGSPVKFTDGTVLSTLLDEKFYKFVWFDGEWIVEGIEPVEAGGGGGGASYLVYTALLSQSGTSAPTATVLENTLGGTVVWSRVSAGKYKATLTGAFTVSKTWLSPTNVNNVDPEATGLIFKFLRIDSNEVQLELVESGGLLYTDDYLLSNPIEIRVYP